MECELYDGKDSSVPGKKQSVDSMLIIKQEVVDNAIESTVYKNYENLQGLISNSTTVSNSRDRNPDDAKNILLDRIKQEPCSPENEVTNNLHNGYIEEWTYIDKTAVKDEENNWNKLKDQTDGVTDQIPYQDEEEPVMYIFNAENDMSELNDTNENVNTGEVQNRRKRKGTKPKKIRQNVEKIEDLKQHEIFVHEEGLNGNISPVDTDYFNIVGTKDDDLSGQSTNMELTEINIHNDQSVLDENLPVKQSTADLNLINDKNMDALLIQNALEESLNNSSESTEGQSIEKESSKLSEHNDSDLDFGACSESLKTVSDIESKSENKQKRFDCSECSKSFSRKDSLNTHFRLHTGQNIHECNLCGKIFPKRSNYIRHMESCGKRDRRVTQNEVLNENSYSKDFTAIEQFDASENAHCDNMINDKNMDALLIQNALEESLNNSSESTEGQLSIEKENSKLSEHDESYLDFNACSESLKTASDIESKSENKQKRFDCSECSKSFSRRDSLTTHFRLHTRQNIHECNLCGKIFPKRSNYIRHMESCGKRERRVTQNEVLNEKSNSEDFTAIEQFDTSQNALGDKATKICVLLEKHVWTHDQESFDEMKYKDGSEDLPVRKRLPKILFKSSELEESANGSSVCEMTPTETDEYSTEEPLDNTYMVQVKIEPEELE
ncbi:Hypothetical predicted protein [Mytilus galloprovincialis]|uniref:C2H2-type domain-containing protein n=1 Tax=Mytilus galloprovincialis TaxID=29158 RepID=A0A8B6DZS9_MYTGA|nr:Hypothetical predicted protein [Mytilus galloprovincialis]